MIGLHGEIPFHDGRDDTTPAECFVKRSQGEIMLQPVQPAGS